MTVQLLHGENKRHRLGAANPNYRNGKAVDGMGYVQLTSKEHGADCGRREHRVVMERVLDAADRNDGLPERGNHHPTVKPTDLMRWLVRLVTPPGGVVLDPFMGSGSTLKAAELEGFSAIGIEREADYIAIARRRIASDAPLFAEVAA